jgi:hypothetical protein
MQHEDPRFDRYREAYLAMAERALYRPQAPGDGCGNVYLDETAAKDPVRLADEADRYAAFFLRQDKAVDYVIGCPAFQFNRAFCWTIEAAGMLCSPDPARARKLLEMAIAEIDKELPEFKRRTGLPG